MMCTSAITMLLYGHPQSQKPLHCSILWANDPWCMYILLDSKGDSSQSRNEAMADLSTASFYTHISWQTEIALGASFTISEKPICVNLTPSVLDPLPLVFELNTCLTFPSQIYPLCSNSNRSLVYIPSQLIHLCPNSNRSFVFHVNLTTCVPVNNAWVWRTNSSPPCSLLSLFTMAAHSAGARLCLSNSLCTLSSEVSSYLWAR